MRAGLTASADAVGGWQGDSLLSRTPSDRQVGGGGSFRRAAAARGGRQGNRVPAVDPQRSGTAAAACASSTRRNRICGWCLKRQPLDFKWLGSLPLPPPHRPVGAPGATRRARTALNPPNIPIPKRQHQTDRLGYTGGGEGRQARCSNPADSRVARQRRIARQTVWS